jgi:HEAT repeat protein
VALFGPPDVKKMKANRDVSGLIKALEYKRKNVDRKTLLIYRSPMDEKEIEYQSAGDIRKDAIYALEQLGDKRAVEPLITALEKEPYDNYRSYAARSLGRLGDARAIEALVNALNHDPSSQVGRAAQDALRLLGWKGKNVYKELEGPKELG